MPTTWKSEAAWRKALDLLRSQLSERERPDFILYRRGVLDEAYTQKHVAKMRQRFERILAGGLPEWRDGYDR